MMELALRVIPATFGHSTRTSSVCCGNVSVSTWWSFFREIFVRDFRWVSCLSTPESIVLTWRAGIFRCKCNSVGFSIWIYLFIIIIRKNGVDRWLLCVYYPRCAEQIACNSIKPNLPVLQMCWSSWQIVFCAHQMVSNCFLFVSCRTIPILVLTRITHISKKHCPLGTFHSRSYQFQIQLFLMDIFVWVFLFVGAESWVIYLMTGSVFIFNED